MNYINLLKIAMNALDAKQIQSLPHHARYYYRGCLGNWKLLAIGQGSKQSIKDQISTMGSNMIFVISGSEQRVSRVMMGNSNAQNMKMSDVDALKAM